MIKVPIIRMFYFNRNSVKDSFSDLFCLFTFTNNFSGLVLVFFLNFAYKYDLKPNFMKIVYLLIVMLLSCSFAQAQYSKGTQLLAGSFGYTNNQGKTKDTSVNTNTRNNNSYQLNLFARYGLFLTNHWLVGAYGNYSNSLSKGSANYSSSDSYSYRNTSELYTMGLFGRYYQTISGRFSWFAQISAGAGSGKSFYNSTTTNTTSFLESHTNSKNFYANLNFTPGIIYFLNSKFALETTFGNVGYSYNQTRNFIKGVQISENNYSNFNSNFFFSFSNILFGINYYFGGNKKANTLEAKKE